MKRPIAREDQWNGPRKMKVVFYAMLSYLENEYKKVNYNNITKNVGMLNNSGVRVERYCVVYTFTYKKQ